MNSFEEICGLYLTLETLPSILWYRLLINTECKTVVVLLQETSFNYINVKIQKFTHNNSFLIFFSTPPPQWFTVVDVDDDCKLLLKICIHESFITQSLYKNILD